MTKEEFIRKLDRWDINESRFCDGIMYFKEQDDLYVFSAFTHGWLPVYLNKDNLIRFVRGELNINDIGV